jgi:SAM-dependent methyltransferase
MHAELYDVIYQDKPYEQEALFVHQILQKYHVGNAHRLLELACGTGNHALLYEKCGYSVTAIDNSEAMLSVARLKAKSAESAVVFRCQDMRSLPIAGAPFDSVVCLFDSIGYVRTNEGFCQVLDGIHRSLRDEGLLIFEFWHAAAMLRKFEPVRVRRWKLKDGLLSRISETRLICDQQLAEVSYDIHKLSDDGTCFSIKETQVNRYFLVQEMRALLTSRQFIPLKFFAGFKFDEKINEDVWHVIAVARKSSAQPDSVR